MARLRGANHPPPASAGPKPERPFDLATIAWLNAQDLACRLEATRERRRQLQERIWKGQEWIEQHDEGHPKWKRAQELLYLLEAQHEVGRYQIEWLHHACWDHTCQTFCAYQHCTGAEKARWHGEHHPTDVSSPQALWTWLDTGCGALDWPRQGEGGFGWYADGRVYHGFDWR